MPSAPHRSKPTTTRAAIALLLTTMSIPIAPLASAQNLPATTTETLAAAAIPTDSRLTAATVYPDRAVVRRTARVSVPGGTREIRFTTLPATLLDASVQVSARGTVAASLLDIATRTTYVTAEPDARLKALEDQLNNLRREARNLNDRQAILESQRALVGTIEQAYTATPTAPAVGTTAPARPTLDDYTKLLSFSAQQRERLNEETQSLELENTALQEKIAAAEAQYAALAGQQKSRRATKTVTVRLATPAAGELDLTLSYAVPGASWSPAYDARLLTATRQVQLDAFGQVRNATGEDWNGIELTLSTARPSLGGAAPEISPWYVDINRPITYGAADTESDGLFDLRRKSKRPDPSSTVIGQPMMAAAPAPEAAPIDATFATAAIETAATSANFKIATPVTLASDNTPQRVPLGAVSLAADLTYQATPKLQETAYLTAHVRNTSELPFLGGTQNVFLDDTFVAAARLATTMPGEKFTLSLGADEGIALKRKIISRFTEDTGFTTKSRRTTYDIVVTVTNNKRTAERIVLTDVAPVARDEKIVVKLLAPTERELLKPEEAAAQPPKPGIARDAEGKLTWRLDLKPGEKRDIPLKFSIEHPADLPVTGVE